MAKLIPHYALAEKIGDEVTIDAGSVKELIDKGIAAYGEPFREAVASAAIVVNGRDVAVLRGVKTRLSADDTVWLLLPAGGG